MFITFTVKRLPNGEYTYFFRAPNRTYEIDTSTDESEAINCFLKEEETVFQDRKLRLFMSLIRCQNKNCFPNLMKKHREMWHKLVEDKLKFRSSTGTYEPYDSILGWLKD
jgi:hypothetical protein